MTRAMRTMAGVLALWVSLADTQNRAAATDDSLSGALPSGASMYVEANNLGDVVTRFEKSELFKLLTSTPQWRTYLESSDYQRLDAGRKFVEAQLGEDAIEAAKKLLGRNLAVGLYPKRDSKQPDVAFVLRSNHPAFLSKARDQVDNLSRLFGKTVLDSTGKAAGVWMWTVQGNLYFASKNDWVAIATSKPLAEQCVRLLQKESADSLTANADFALAMKEAAPTAHIRVFADLRKLMEATGKKPQQTKFDNVVGAWLFGGVVELARLAPVGSATLTFGKSGLDTTVHLPVDWSKPSAGMVGFFTKPGEAGAAEFPALPTTIAGFSFQRDFVHLYKSREVNLQARILPEFDKFETGIANLMPGRSFSEDILPLLGRRLSILVGPQKFDHLGGEPALKLPGFAFVFEPGTSEQANDLFQLLFQSVVSILNFQVGERGGEPMVIRAEVHNGVPISYGRHMKSAAKGPLPFAFNFTPSSARVNEKLILSSSLDFCRQLTDSYRTAKDVTANHVTADNAAFVAKADAIADGLAANRSFLESKIVQSGKSAGQAKIDFDLLSTMLRKLDQLRAVGTVRVAGYDLRISLSWK